MMDDTTVSVMVVLVFMASFLFGRIQDPMWRCLMLRRLTKKNWIIVVAKNMGSRLQSSFVANAESGEIHIGDNAWIIAKNRIYLKKNEKMGFNVISDNIHVENLGLEGAVPVIYVDTNNVKPLFLEGDAAEVSSGEYAANGKKYLANEKAKIIAQAGGGNMLMVILAIGVLAAAGLGFLVFDKLNQLEPIIKAQQPHEPTNQTAQAAQYIENAHLSEKEANSGFNGVFLYG